MVASSGSQFHGPTAPDNSQKDNVSNINLAGNLAVTAIESLFDEILTNKDAPEELLVLVDWDRDGWSLLCGDSHTLQGGGTAIIGVPPLQYQAPLRAHTADLGHQDQSDVDVDPLSSALSSSLSLPLPLLPLGATLSSF